MRKHQPFNCSAFQWVVISATSDRASCVLCCTLVRCTVYSVHVLYTISVRCTMYNVQYAHAYTINNIFSTNLTVVLFVRFPFNEFWLEKYIRSSVSVMKIFSNFVSYYTIWMMEWVRHVTSFVSSRGCRQPLYEMYLYTSIAEHSAYVVSATEKHRSQFFILLLCYDWCTNMNMPCSNNRMRIAIQTEIFVEYPTNKVFPGFWIHSEILQKCINL